MHRTLTTVVLLAGLSFAVSCSPTQQITTAPPRSGIPVDTTSANEANASIAIQMGAGDSALPEGVQSIRFRIADVWLKQTGESWVSIPADVNQFVVPPGERSSKIILSTSIPPGRYDSLGLSFAEVFVLFDANSGSPLTMPRDEPLRMALSLEATSTQPSAISLSFEPGASLTRTDDCRWFFVPFVTQTGEHNRP